MFKKFTAKIAAKNKDRAKYGILDEILNVIKERSNQGYNKIDLKTDNGIKYHTFKSLEDNRPLLDWVEDSLVELGFDVDILEYEGIPRFRHIIKW